MLHQPIQICAGATIAYNTIFTRSHPTLSYLTLKSIPAFQRAQLDLIRKKCMWIELVRDDPGELEHAHRLRDRLTPTQKLRYRIKTLKTMIPLLQLLVMKRGEDSGAAFVGWLHEGATVSMVWFTENMHAINWYFGYCRKLSECADEQERTASKRRSNRVASLGRPPRS